MIKGQSFVSGESQVTAVISIDLFPPLPHSWRVPSYWHVLFFPPPLIWSSNPFFMCHVNLRSLSVFGFFSSMNWKCCCLFSSVTLTQSLCFSPKLSCVIPLCLFFICQHNERKLNQTLVCQRHVNVEFCIFMHWLPTSYFSWIIMCQEVNSCLTWERLTKSKFKRLLDILQNK